jgi:hypothetical protein
MRYILFVITIFLFNSCKSPSAKNVVESNILSIVAPEKAIVGDNVEIEITFYGANGCSEPYNIKAEKVGQTITLRAYYLQPMDEVCTEILPSYKLNYTFFADLPGPYFIQSALNNQIADTLVVY